MRAILGIRNQQDDAACRAFLESQRGISQAYAVAVVPTPRGLTSVIDYPRRHANSRLSRLLELQKASAADLLAQFKASAQRPGLQIQTDVMTGNPAGQLISAARARSADFIIVTRRHGERRDGPNLGHVASRVARYAPCSALLLDHNAPAPTTILYATDGSHQAQTAGMRLRDLRLSGSPTLFICTVVQSLNAAFMRTGGHGYEEFQRIREEFRRDEEAAAQKVLAAAAALFRDSGYRTRNLTYEGDPVIALMSIIRQQRVDLLVLGAKGVSAVAEFLLGSITLRMLGRATCSMLVAR